MYTAFTYFNPLKQSSYYIYHLFNIKELCNLNTEYIYAFHTILRINSNYLPTLH
jgi:hypothetical protein